MTGLRFGELSALEWSDLDEAEGEVRVTRSQVRQVVNLPKTKKRRRSVLLPEVFELLRLHRKELIEAQAPGLDRNLVFPSKVGKYRYPSLLNKVFRQVVDDAGIDKHVTAQTLRRTFNNLLDQAGVRRVVLQAMMGHSSDRMTEHYSHVSAEEKRVAVVAFKPLVERLCGSSSTTGEKRGIAAAEAKRPAANRAK